MKVNEVRKNLKNFTCSICNRSFGYKSTLTHHVKSVHEQVKPFTCLTCNYSFAQRGDLNRHVRTVHEKKKPFMCLICKKSFGARSGLDEHIKIVHEKVKKFTCFVCNKSFGLKSNLNRHMQEVHENDKPFTCLACNKSFGRKTCFKQHLKIVHKKEKPLTCLICNKKIGLLGNLNVHIKRVHENVRPFTCLICNKSFGLKRQFEQHVQSVHDKEKPFSCAICNHKFGSKGSMVKHVKNTHTKDWATTTTTTTSNLDDKNINLSSNVDDQAPDDNLLLSRQSCSAIPGSFENIRDIEEETQAGLVCAVDVKYSILVNKIEQDKSMVIEEAEEAKEVQVKSLKVVSENIENKNVHYLSPNSRQTPVAAAVTASNMPSSNQTYFVNSGLSEKFENTGLEAQMGSKCIVDGQSLRFMNQGKLDNHNCEQLSTRLKSEVYDSIQAAPHTNSVLPNDLLSTRIKSEDDDSDTALPNESVINERITNIKQEAQATGSCKSGDNASLTQVNCVKKEQSAVAETGVLKVFDSNEVEVIRFPTCGLTFESNKLLSRHQEDHTFMSAEKKRKISSARDDNDDDNDNDNDAADLQQCPLCCVKLENQHLDQHFLEHSKAIKERKQITTGKIRREDVLSEYNDLVVDCPHPSCVLKFNSKDLLYQHALKEHNKKR